eukprot:6003326-Lingulodinium_polyedra.AAC.1
MTMLRQLCTLPTTNPHNRTSNLFATTWRKLTGSVLTISGTTVLWPPGAFDSDTRARALSKRGTEMLYLLAADSST